jgi:hypothetical protein
MRSDYSGIAQSILASVRSNFLPEHDYALATASAFKHLNMDFYRKTQASLETLGFVVVADVEDRTISNAGSVVTFIRTMRHPGTEAMAAFFFVPPMARGFVELETLLSDKHFIVDTNIPQGDSIADFPDIDMAYHAPGSALKKISNAHSRRVRERLSRRKGTKVEPIATFEAFVHAQNLMNRSKHDHLASIGWVTLDYLKRQTRGDDEMAKGVHEAIQDILGGKMGAKPPRRAGSTAMEMATRENEELVSRVYTQALQDRHDGRKLAAADLMVYHIEMLSQEGQQRCVLRAVLPVGLRRGDIRSRGPSGVACPAPGRPDPSPRYRRGLSQWPACDRRGEKRARRVDRRAGGAPERARH